MPRIRSIKPEFWQDTKLSRLPIFERLLYICLWSMADDEGRIEGDAETVWHFGFPREKVETVSRGLAKLREASIALPYLSARGIGHLFLPNFTRHQRIDHASKSKLPPPPEDIDSKRVASSDEALANPREDSSRTRRALALDQGAGIMDQGAGSRIPSAGADTALDPAPSAVDLPEKRTKSWLSETAPDRFRKAAPLIIELWNKTCDEMNAAYPSGRHWTKCRGNIPSAAASNIMRLLEKKESIGADVEDAFTCVRNDPHWTSSSKNDWKGPNLNSFFVEESWLIKVDSGAQIRESLVLVDKEEEEANREINEKFAEYQKTKHLIPTVNGNSGSKGMVVPPDVMSVNQ